MRTQWTYISQHGVGTQQGYEAVQRTKLFDGAGQTLQRQRQQYTTTINTVP